MPVRKRTKKLRTYKHGGTKRMPSTQRRSYSSQDIQSFRDYIMILEDNDQKSWLLSNIERMPYRRNYQPNWHMTNPSDPYNQGLDRIGGYLAYGEVW